MTQRLPPGWLETTFHGVFRTTGGGTPATGRSEFWGDGIPWITSADIDDAGEISPRKAVTPSGIAHSATTAVPPGSVVVVTRVGLGKVALAMQELCFSQDCQALLFDPELLAPSFVTYQTRRTVRGIRGRGTTIAGVTVKELGALPFSLAPLPEQHRIVEAIDSYLTRLDDAVASLDRVQAKLKPFGASVLKAAVEGHLVPTEASLTRAEKRGYEPAEVLLARVLKERRSQWEDGELAKLKAAGKAPKDDRWKAKYKEPRVPDSRTLRELPEGWCWATVDQLCVKITDGEHLSPRTKSAGVPLLSAKDIREHGVVLDDPKFVTADDAERFRGRCNPERGDIVMVSRGATIGRTAVVQVDDTFCLMGSVILLKVHPLVMSEYLCFNLRTATVKERLVALSGSTAQQAIYIRDIRRLVVALPPMLEQVRVVDQVSRTLSVADEGNLECVRASRRASSLRQSILKWAFEGRLVDQEQADEPAERLLARIRAERATDNPTKKTLVLRQGAA